MMEAKYKELREKLKQYMEASNGVGCWRKYVGSQLEADIVYFTESLLSKQQEEINKLLKSHSDWMDLALERKEEIKKLKEDLKEADKAIISFAKGLDKERKENKQLKQENERLRGKKEISLCLRHLKGNCSLLPSPVNCDSCDKWEES